MPTIGWIGLGTMGMPMAENALKAGFSLKVYNRTKDKAAPLLDKGAQWASTPAEAATNVDVVWTMLADDTAIRQVFFDNHGVLSKLEPGTLVIDSSTVSPATSAAVGAAVADIPAHFLDAPVSGSEPHAQQAALTFMVGGDEHVYEAAKPYFEALGKTSYYLGEHGAGSKTKLAINTLLGIQLLGFAETLTLVQKAGIDPHQFVQIIMGGAVRSGIVEAKAEKMINHEFSPQFTSALLLKDLKLAQRFADRQGAYMPLLSAVKEIVRSSIARGGAHEDMSAVVSFFEQSSH